MRGQKKLFHQDKYGIYAPEDLGKKWFVYYYEGTKRVRVYGKINQERDADARRAAAEALIGKLKQKDLPTITVAEERVRAFLERNQGRWKQKTREQYSSIATVFFAHINGRAVSREAVAEFLAHIASSKHPTTYNKYRQKLKYLLVKAGLGDLTQGTESLRATSTPARYFQRYQVQRLKSWMQEHDTELWLFCQFVYYCFVRPGELRWLRVGDILYDDAQIVVRAEISKNRKQQYVAIPDAFLPDLLGLMSRLPGALVFPGALDASKPVGINSMYRRHQKALDALGFGAGYTLYSWKHTGAVAAAKAGVSVKELQIQLRHHSLDMTDRYLRQMGVQDVVKLRSEFPGV
jgi:integrase